MHDLIELLELYPAIFEKYCKDLNVCKYISSNPNLTFEYVLSCLDRYTPWFLNGLYLCNNPSVTTPQTVDKLPFKMNRWNFLSNLAFDEEEVSQRLNQFEKWYYVNDDSQQPHKLLHFLGQNKNITPQFHYIKNIWLHCWYEFASNEHFMPLVYKHIQTYKHHANLIFHVKEHAEKLITNRALTIEMFISIFGNSNNPWQGQYIENNPTLLLKDLNKFTYNCFTIHSNQTYYFANLNTNPFGIDHHDDFHAIAYLSKNPRLPIKHLLKILNKQTLKTKCIMIYDTYSKNPNVTWENVDDYSWLSWNWKHLAQNSFNSSPLYRHATLLNELFDLIRRHDFDYTMLLQIL